MEKRYQVFISSTKKDLEAARSEVSRALLRAKCFPAQMENFNAVDEGQMDHIKRVIDQSDYFVLILGGMYGSIEPVSGKSYTQLEYEYAVAEGKPIVRLLRNDPFTRLTGDRIEQDAKKRKKLESFRHEVSKNKLCRFWDSEKELGAEVTLALTDMKESHPAVGWVRGNEIQIEARAEIGNLRAELAELKLASKTPERTQSKLEGLEASALFLEKAVLRLFKAYNLDQIPSAEGILDCFDDDEQFSWKRLGSALEIEFGKQVNTKEIRIGLLNILGALGHVELDAQGNWDFSSAGNQLHSYVIARPYVKID